MKDYAIRFLIYFALAVGYLYLYVDNPELNSNATFVYQDF
jgi:hypothetical protein